MLDLGVKIVFTVVEDIDNTKLNPEWEEVRKERTRFLPDNYREKKINSFCGAISG